MAAFANAVDAVTEFVGAKRVECHAGSIWQRIRRDKRWSANLDGGKYRHTAATLV